MVNISVNIWLPWKHTKAKCSQTNSKRYVGYFAQSFRVAPLLQSSKSYGRSGLVILRPVFKVALAICWICSVHGNPILNSKAKLCTRRCDEKLGFLTGLYFICYIVFLYLSGVNKLVSKVQIQYRNKIISLQSYVKISVGGRLPKLLL